MFTLLNALIFFIQHGPLSFLFTRGEPVGGVINVVAGLDGGVTLGDQIGFSVVSVVDVIGFLGFLENLKREIKESLQGVAG